MNRLSLVVAGLALAWTVPAVAHHGFAAEFDKDAPITLRGTLAKMEWINPHGWIYIDVKQPDGKVVTWAVETGSGNQLLRRGLRKTDFPIGSELIVDGYRARNGKATVNGSSVKFANGRNFNLGAPADAPQPQGGAQR